MDPYVELMNHDIAARDAVRDEQNEWREIYAMATGIQSSYSDGLNVTIGGITFSVDALKMISPGQRKQYVINSLSERALRTGKE